MQGIQGLLKFAELMNRFREIERTILINGSSRRENDVEHSYQLAMVAWYAIEVNKLSLNVDLTIKYALIHDLVEVYAGDTFAYDADPSVHASKVDRELAALVKIKEEFAEFPELASVIETYEKREDEESKFVYALDKVIAPMNIYMDGGRVWKENNITLEQHYNNKKDKVKKHIAAEQFYEELLTLMRKNESELFTTQK